MAKLRESQLGPWLVQMVQQKLDEAQKKEQILKARFEETRTEAINLSGQLAQIELLERDVKRLSDMNDVLMNQIASLDLRQNGQDVRVAVIEEPTMTTSPAFPRLSYVVLFTLVGGFGAALALVTSLDALDDRFRSVDEMQSRLGLPLLAMIQQLEAPESAGEGPGDARHAHFRGERKLPHVANRTDADASRRPADRRDQRRAGRRQDDHAGQPGGLLCPGRKANLVDRRRLAAARVDGLDEPAGAARPERGPSFRRRHLAGGGRACPSLGRTRLGHSAFRSPAQDPAELLGGPRFSQLLAWAETVYDLILIDSPPTLATTDTAIIGRLVDGVIVVVQPARTAAAWSRG